MKPEATPAEPQPQKKTPTELLAELQQQEKQIEANLHHVRGAIEGLKYAIGAGTPE